MMQPPEVIVLNTLKDLSVGVVARTAQSFGMQRCIVFGHSKFNKRSAVGCLNFEFLKISGYTEDTQLCPLKFQHLVESLNLYPVFISSLPDDEFATPANHVNFKELIHQHSPKHVALVSSPDADNSAYIPLFLHLQNQNIPCAVVRHSSLGVLRAVPSSAFTAHLLFKLFSAVLDIHGATKDQFVEPENWHDQPPEDVTPPIEIPCKDSSSRRRRQKNQAKQEVSLIPSAPIEQPLRVHVGRFGVRNDGFRRKVRHYEPLAQ